MCGAAGGCGYVFCEAYRGKKDGAPAVLRFFELAAPQHQCMLCAHFGQAHSRFRQAHFGCFLFSLLIPFRHFILNFLLPKKKRAFFIE